MNNHVLLDTDIDTLVKYMAVPDKVCKGMGDKGERENDIKQETICHELEKFNSVSVFFT